MTRPEIQVRKPDESDVPEILELLRLCLGEGEIPRTKEFWRWKHQNNPFGASPARLAVAGGRIIGVRVFMRFDWVAGGQRIKCARPVDTVTHPEWRRQGVFSELTRELAGALEKDEVSLIFNTPNDKSLPANISLGWSKVGQIRFAVKLVRPFRVIGGRLYRGDDDSDTGRHLRIPEQKRMRAEEIGILPIEEFLSLRAARRFVQDCRSSYGDGFSGPISEEYIHWRYGSIPTVEYYASWDRNTKSAIIFRLTTSRGLVSARMCEVLVHPSRIWPSGARDSLRKMIEFVEPDYVLTVASGGRASRWSLYRLGFIPIPGSGRTLVARQNGERAVGGIDPHDPNSWELPMGWLEIF